MNACMLLHGNICMCHLVHAWSAFSMSLLTKYTTLLPIYKNFLNFFNVGLFFNSPLQVMWCNKGRQITGLMKTIDLHLLKRGS